MRTVLKQQVLAEASRGWFLTTLTIYTGPVHMNGIAGKQGTHQPGIAVPLCVAAVHWLRFHALLLLLLTRAGQ